MTKILVTIGPFSENDDILYNINNKTNLFRLNGSHNSIAWHSKVINKIKKINEDAFVLLDIPGIKPRTNNKNNIRVEKDEIISFSESEIISKYRTIPLTKPIPKIDPKLKNFTINDGQFEFEAFEVSSNYILGKSKTNFNLLPKKGINFPNSIYLEDKQFEVYRDFIDKIKGLNICGLGLSFVQSKEIVKKVKNLCKELTLVSKIENIEGYKNRKSIIAESDAIMIDRGDLAAEIGLENLYVAVKNISMDTKQQGKPLIMATENLETMVFRETPSKSEVISIANSIEIGSDCIMLSEETATSENCLKTIEWLDEFIKKDKVVRKEYEYINTNKYNEIWDMIDNSRNKNFLIMTKSGYALNQIQASKPLSNIFIVTDNLKLGKTIKLFAKEPIFLYEKIKLKVPIETILKIVKKYKKIIFQKSKNIVCIYVSTYLKEARANCITILDENDLD